MGEMRGAVELPEDRVDARSRGYDVDDFMYNDDPPEVKGYTSGGPVNDKCCGITDWRHAKDLNQLVRLTKLNHMSIWQHVENNGTVVDSNQGTFPTIRGKWCIGDLVFVNVKLEPYATNFVRDHTADDPDAWLQAGGRAVIAAFGGPQDVVLNYMDNKGRVQRSSASWGSFSRTIPVAQ